MYIEERINQLGYSLPDVAIPVGSYLNCVRTGNLLHISGGLPFTAEEKVQGVVPTVCSVAKAQRGAKIVILNRLAVARAELGSLDYVSRVVSMTGLVNCTKDFYDHPLVINAASNLLVDIFGERGKHARLISGVTSLPMNAAVEISLVLEIA